MKAKSLWKFLKGSVVQWIEDDPFPLAAALSYYTLFSLAPLLIIVIAVAGFAFGQEAAQNRIVAGDSRLSLSPIRAIGWAVA